jgi:hypothetical protein
MGELLCHSSLPGGGTWDSPYKGLLYTLCVLDLPIQMIIFTQYNE